MNQLILFSLLCALLGAIATILLKSVFKTHGIGVVTLMFGILYFISALLFFGFNKDRLTSDVRTISVPLVAILTVAVILSFISTLIYNRLVAEHDPAIVAALVSTAPLFILVYQYLVQGDQISPKQLVGIVAIITGIYCVS